MSDDVYAIFFFAHHFLQAAYLPFRNFKPPKHCLICLDSPCEHRNTLTFRIQPNEGIALKFWVKRPGLKNELEKKELSFAYADSLDSVALPDAYERLFYDALMGEQTLFASTDEVQAAWRYITPSVAGWNGALLKVYEKGEMVSDDE